MDEVVTWRDVAENLGADVRRTLEMAQPPNMRGWYTADEAAADGGQFVEVRTMSEREPKFLRIGDARG